MNDARPSVSQGDVLRANVGVRREPERHDASRGPGGVPGDDGVVRVEDGHAVGPQRFDRLRRGLHDPLPRSEHLEVRDPHVGHDAMSGRAIAHRIATSPT